LNKILDLRSDTVTRPTEEMRDAMRDAEVGDDVLRDDKTVEKLEKMGAEIFGKEACLLTATGTMSNQAAVLSLTGKGEQIILHDNAHMYNLELAALAQVCGVQPRPIKTIEGRYDLEELKSHIMPEKIQSAPTTLICMENSFDLNQGLAIDKKHIDEVCGIAHFHNIPVYMDGARIFNAAIGLDTTVKDLCRNVDVVAVCLTKGLSCPIGSLLVGPKYVIEKARRMRQMLGGGWRQAGIIAAAGVVALNDIDKLKEDHKKAQILAKGLKDLGLGIDLNQVQTNIIRIDVSTINSTAKEFCNLLNEKNVKAKPIGATHVRMICHKDVEFDDLDTVLKSVEKTINFIKE
jgi:threonine aldolase